MSHVVRNPAEPAREVPRRTTVRRATGRRTLLRGLQRRFGALAVATLLVQAVAVVSPAPSASAATVPDDAACSPRSSITIDAHTDDDLFFQNPDVQRAVTVAATGASCYRGVYVTAGDAGRDADAGYWQSREQGVEAAYATMAGVADVWSAQTRTFAGQPVVVATLRDAPTVSLAFLRLPDGDVDGSGFGTYGDESLQKLYTGSISSISTVEDVAGTGTSYTLAQLSATIGALVLAQDAHHVRTLDFAGSFGDGDHSDHHAVGFIVRDEVRAVAPGATLAGYTGYPGAGRPANLSTSTADFSAKAAAFEAYAPHDALMECRTAQSCLTGSRRGNEGAWLQRQYTVAGSQDPDPATDPTFLPNPAPSADLARSASVVASSESEGTDQTAVKAVDGVVDGYPGLYSAEWASAGESVGATLTVSWAAPVSASRVVLFDRPNLDDRVTSGTLVFSDGSSVAVGALADDGSATVVSFPPRVTSRVLFRVSGVSASTHNVGLAEIQVFSDAASTPTSSPTTSSPTASPTGGPSTSAPTSSAPTASPTSGAPTADVARSAVVTASSENPADGQAAAAAVDGVASGYPAAASAEWATRGGRAGSWLDLAFPAPVVLDRVVLFDRPNADDQVTAGTLVLSDGTSVAVPALANDGSATTVTFPSRSTRSLRFTATTVSGSTRNVGLAEIEAWTAASATTPVPPTTTPTGSATTAPPATSPPTTSPSGPVDLAGSASVLASSENSSTGQTAAKAVDGVVDGYPGVSSAEWATTGQGAGASLTVSWPAPVSVSRVVLFDRPNLDDRVVSGTLTFSDGSSVAVGGLADDGSATEVPFPARSTSRVVFTVTGVSASTRNVGLAEIQAFAAV